MTDRMPPYVDLNAAYELMVGKVFGRWTVTAAAGRSTKRRERMFRCICICGNESTVLGRKLLRGYTKSCGCSKASKARPLTDRFWEKVTRAGKDECWLWNASLNSHGYGQIAKGGKADGGSIASRVSWELTNGPIPDQLDVLHRCDVPACVNPQHLFLGTHLDNMRDMANKKRIGKPIVWNGQKKYLAEWAKPLGLTRSALWCRLNRRGWSLEKALTQRSRYAR